MKLAITLQQLTWRGNFLPTQRVAGRQYTFQWNTAKACYMWEPPTLEDANFLLKNLFAFRHLLPGVCFVEGQPQADSLAAAPKVVAPVPQPKIAETPEVEKIPTKAQSTKKKVK